MSNPILLAVHLLLALHHAPGVPSSAVHAAKRECAAAFGRIGVGVEWVDDSRRGGAIPIMVWADESRVMRQIKSDVLGAVVGGGDGREGAWLFFRRVERATDTYGLDAGVVLGDAIAHEIGHLLLPRNTHGPNGLMGAAWGQDDLHRAVRGQLGFSPAEAARIRAALGAREVASAHAVD